MGKIWLFRSVAVVIPVLFFVLLELGLRLVGFGQRYSLFIENPDAPHYLLPRPDVIKRYFPPGAQVPTVTIETNFFLREKPDNGLRIFVQGGSTAAGFPYGYGASIAGMLDYRMKQTFPDRPVEVVNTALSAVNSFTLLDFSEEIIEQKPDAVLIYAGHNEYLGLLGAGSSYTIAGSRGMTLLFLKLKDLRIFQGLQYLYWEVAGKSGQVSDHRSRTTMAKLAGKTRIPLGSNTYNAGVEQLRGNLSLLIQTYQRANIPVFVATIASNLGNQEPFISAALGASETGIPDELITLTNSSTSSSERFEQIARQVSNSSSADLHFALARAYVRLDRHEIAIEHFRRARDLDQLRFRAPSPFNEVIRDQARAVGVYLVDVHAAMVNASPGRIIGQTLMWEHVHPNSNGYFIIADAFYRALGESGALGDFPNPVASDRAREDLPLLAAEEYLAAAKIAELKADYPFVPEPVAAQLPTRKSWSDRLGFQAYQKEIGWMQMASVSLEHHEKTGDKKSFAKVAKLLADAVPHHAPFSYRAGVGLIQAGKPQQAPRYLLRAIDQAPSVLNYQLALIHAYYLQNRIEDLKPWVRSVLDKDPGNQTAQQVAERYSIQ